jgi:hypothetical protein
MQTENEKAVRYPRRKELEKLLNDYLDFNIETDGLAQRTREVIASLKNAESANEEPKSANDGVAQQRVPMVRAKPILWNQSDVYPDGVTEWTEGEYGFYVRHDPSEDDGYQYHAAWGEGDTEHFGTLEEAKAWCQSEIDGWVAHVCVIDQAAIALQVSNTDGWIDWPGGGCPVTPDELVEVEYRSATPNFPATRSWPNNAREFYWEHLNGPNDIVRYRVVSAAPKAPQQVSNTPKDEFQQRVQPWMMACFGPEISADTVERNHRFLEEALELVQACGCTQSEAHQLVDYVYGRPVGEKHQEVGGVMVTLAALCLAQGLNMHEAGEIELARIWTKVGKIRAKQAAKPKHSPLPEHVQQEQSDAVAAMNRAKKLPVWYSVPHELHKELDIIFRALSAAPTPPQQEQSGEAVARLRWVKSLKEGDLIRERMTGEAVRVESIFRQDGLAPDYYFLKWQNADRQNGEFNTDEMVELFEAPTSPATPTATASQESAPDQSIYDRIAARYFGSAPGQEAVAWVRKEGSQFHFDWTSIKDMQSVPDGKHSLFLAPPTSTAIAAMVIRQAANCCKAWMEPFDIQRKILALTPANAEAELEALMMKVAEEVRYHMTLAEKPEELDANARRIVACVNACKGISTEKLEGPGVLVNIPDDHNIIAQRDKLLAALEDSLTMIGRLKKHCQITDNAGYTADGRMLKLTEVEESARAIVRRVLDEKGE